MKHPKRRHPRRRVRSQRPDFECAACGYASRRIEDLDWASQLMRCPACDHDFFGDIKELRDAARRAIDRPGVEPKDADSLRRIEETVTKFIALYPHGYLNPGTGSNS